MLVPSHFTRTVREVRGEHISFTDKNTEAQRREGDLRGSALHETR